MYILSLSSYIFCFQCGVSAHAQTICGIMAYISIYMCDVLAVVCVVCLTDNISVRAENMPRLVCERCMNEAILCTRKLINLLHHPMYVYYTRI